MSEFIGPVLPPQNKKDKEIGPVLPPVHLNESESEEEQLLDAPNESKELDPCLPSQKPLEKQHASCYGPALPPHLQKDRDSDESSQELNEAAPESDSYGPALPPRLQNGQDSDEEVYGPLPPGAALSTQAQQALEERALQIKLGHLDSNEKLPSREEWMIELPDVKRKTLGLGPRQFRKNTMPDFSDRSSWTDTPQDKAKKGKKEEKVDLKKESERKELLKRDEEQQKMADTHSKTKKRNKSLLELHQQEQIKKKKNEEEGITRRPFSRDVDLQVNRFDEAQKKSILKKAMLLDDRFSAGQSKFL